MMYRKIANQTVSLKLKALYGLLRNLVKHITNKYYDVAKFSKEGTILWEELFITGEIK